MKIVVNKKTLLRITTILIATMLLLILAFIYIHNESISTKFRDIRFSDYDIVKVATHEFDNDKLIESTLRVTISPVSDTSDYNIVIVFSNNRNNEKYRISNLNMSVKPKSKVKLKSIYFDDGVGCENLNQFTNEEINVDFESKSDYIYLNIITTDYYSDSIEFDLSYDIKGIGIYSINTFKNFSISVTI